MGPNSSIFACTCKYKSTHAQHMPRRLKQLTQASALADRQYAGNHMRPTVWGARKAGSSTTLEDCNSTLVVAYQSHLLLHDLNIMLTLVALSLQAIDLVT
jgi:hypothetical protein